MSHPRHKILSDSLPPGAVTLTPAELNRIRFSTAHTVLTAAVLEAARKAAQQTAAGAS